MTTVAKLLEKWRQPSAKAGPHGIEANARRQCADELEQALADSVEAYAYMMPPDKAILAAHWTGTLPPFGWMPLYTHPKPAQVDGWLPIESAPKDAPYWLVWSAYYQRPVVVTQRRDDNTYWEGDWGFDVQATHWTTALALKPEPRGTQQDSAPGATPTTNPPAQPSAKGE